MKRADFPPGLPDKVGFVQSVLRPPHEGPSPGTPPVSGRGTLETWLHCKVGTGELMLTGSLREESL